VKHCRFAIADCQFGWIERASRRSEIGNWQSAMIEVINRQRKRRISAARMREFAQCALTAIDVGDRDAAVVFVSDAAIRRLNRDFRGRDRATDVLSFPAQPEPFEGKSQLGEVVVSIEHAAAQAKANRLSLTNEIQQLILHGLLHLCGYDHETDNGEMNRLELKLRKKLRI
jgi:probable rRNA maturation factor